MCLEQPLSRYLKCLFAKEPCKKQDQGARFGPLTNLGPMMLVGTLGTHFKLPLGIENLLTLHNLTV